jgi:ubiquinol oxidase
MTPNRIELASKQYHMSVAASVTLSRMNAHLSALAASSAQELACAKSSLFIDLEKTMSKSPTTTASPWSREPGVERTVAAVAHHEPANWSDRIALGFTKSLRLFADLFFRKRYGHRAVVLETVAGVPGMVGATLQHLKSLRRIRDDQGWIRTLLDEAENERMHLMTFIQVSRPTALERALIVAAQGVFYNLFFLIYLVSSRTAHRIVGYFEEEAVRSYTEYLAEIDAGRLPNGPAPQIAIDYWRLPAQATLRDVVIAVRDDEAGHRDVNHDFANRLNDEKQSEAATLRIAETPSGEPRWNFDRAQHN